MINTFVMYDILYCKIDIENITSRELFLIVISGYYITVIDIIATASLEDIDYHITPGQLKYWYQIS